MFTFSKILTLSKTSINEQQIHTATHLIYAKAIGIDKTEFSTKLENVLQKLKNNVLKLSDIKVASLQDLLVTNSISKESMAIKTLVSGIAIELSHCEA